MSLTTRRVLIGSATAFFLLVACGGGVDSSWTSASGGTTISAGGVWGPCALDADCQSACGALSAGNSVWCCALNTSPASCYQWTGTCPAATSTSGTSSSSSGSSSGGGSSGGCTGRGCDAGAGNNNVGAGRGC